MGWSRGLPNSGGSHLAAALSTACQAGEEPLTLSVAPRAWPGQWRPDSPRGTEDRFHRPLVKGCGFHDPERLPSTGAPKESRFRGTVFGGSPPPVSRLCHRGPGFRRAFAAPMLSPGVARPDVVSGALHPGTRRAKRRLSTSAICCDPRAHPTDRPNPAHRAGGRPPAKLFCEPPSFDGGTECGWRCVLRQSQSRCHGPGACSRAICPWRALAPPAAIARGGSFTPTRSARTPHVANPWRRRLE